MKTKEDPNKQVINLTQKKIHKDDFSLLNKNMNFVPNPGKPNKKIFDEDLEKYFRRIILKAHFKDSPTASETTPIQPGFQKIFITA